MSTDTDELDKIIKDLAYVPVDLAQKMFDDLKAKLAEFTRERDEIKRDKATRLCDVDRIKEWWHSIPRKNPALAFTCGPERSIAIGMETLASDLAQAREQLEAAKAEAAAMREAFSKRVSFGCHFWNGANDTYIRFNDREKSLAAEHAIGSFLQGTAGRDLLEEMRRDKERIAELERQLAEQAPLVAIARELREALIGKWRSFGGDYSQDYMTWVRFRTQDDAMKFHDALGKFITLRDAEGGE